MKPRKDLIGHDGGEISGFAWASNPGMRSCVPARIPTEFEDLLTPPVGACWPGAGIRALADPAGASYRSLE